MRERIEAETKEAGLPFRPPELIPSTRLALEAAEFVRSSAPERFGDVHRALFAAYWAEGRDLGDPAVLLEVVAGHGVERSAVDEALRRRTMRQAVDEATAEALEAGVTGTPAWLVDGRLLIPGAQPRETFDRIIARLTG